MRSVLRLFAKMNPVISYVQGMNEVLAPLYYVFRTDSDEAIAVSSHIFCTNLLFSGRITGSLSAQTFLSDMSIWICVWFMSISWMYYLCSLLPAYVQMHI